MELEYVFLISIFVFAVRSIVFSLGSSIERNRKSSVDGSFEPFISIIVPARNEENHIAFTVRSIMQSYYPTDKFELIVVNDRSTDNTKNVLIELSNDYPNLVLVHVTDEMPINNLRGKPGALQAGIDITKGNIILMTDADCTVNPNWIRKMIATYQNDKVGLTASLTNIKGNRIFDKIQAVEWIYMHTMASAGIGLGVPLGCYGNNYSVRKSDYEAVGGYKSIKFSVTEDLALLQAINNNNRQVRYLVDEGSVVDTLPCVTFGEYLKQRHRWAIGGLNLGFKAFVFVASSGAFWGGIMTALITSHIPWLIIILSVRLVCDFLLIYPTLAKIKKEALSMWVLPSIFFFTLMELIVPFLVIKKTVVWKNQVFR